MVKSSDIECRVLFESPDNAREKYMVYQLCSKVAKMSYRHHTDLTYAASTKTKMYDFRDESWAA